MRYLYILLIISPLFFNSCAIFKSSSNEVVHDTVFVQIDNDGNINYIQPTPGLRVQKPYLLSNNYDYVLFKANEKIQLVVDGVDFSESTLKIEKYDEDNSIKISVLPLDSKIVLENKCQIQKWYDPYVLPEITVKDKIINGKKAKDQQIIITPLYNKQCERVGFQIRYGSIERGCAKEGKQVVDEFNKCNGNPRIKGSRPLKLIDIF
jgi:hypothetical protein